MPSTIPATCLGEGWVPPFFLWRHAHSLIAVTPDFVDVMSLQCKYFLQVAPLSTLTEIVISNFYLYTRRLLK